MRRAGGGWWETDARGVPGAPLRVRDRRRRAARRPARARAAGRARGAGAGRRPRGAAPRPTSRGAASSCAGAVIYELHVGTFTPEGTLDSAIERLDHLVALGVDIVEVMPLAKLPGPARLGLRRRRAVRRARALRRPVRVPPLRRRLPRARPRRLPRRRLQPPRAERQPPRASSARTSPTATARRGARPSTSTAPAATRCGASSSTTRSCGCATSTSTALRLDAVHALLDDRAITLLEELTAEVDALSARARPAALADRRVRPQRPAHRHAARARRHRGSTRSGPTTSTTRCTSLLTGETQGYYADFAAPGRAREGARGHVLPRRHLLGVPRAHARRARSTARRCPARASSSRCRRTTRSATARRATGSRPTSRPACWPCGAALLLTARRHADAVHGRGVGRLDAVDVLHRPHRSGDRRGRAQRAAATSSPATAGRSTTCPTRRPSRRSSARASTGTSRRASRTRGCSRGTATSSRCAASAPDLRDPRLDRVHVEHDATARTVVVHRGDHVVVVNLAPAPRTVRAGQRRRRSAWCWPGIRRPHRPTEKASRWARSLPWCSDRKRCLSRAERGRAPTWPARLELDRIDAPLRRSPGRR